MTEPAGRGGTMVTLTAGIWSMSWHPRDVLGPETPASGIGEPGPAPASRPSNAVPASAMSGPGVPGSAGAQPPMSDLKYGTPNAPSKNTSAMATSMAPLGTLPCAEAWLSLAPESTLTAKPRRGAGATTFLGLDGGAGIESPSRSTLKADSR